MYGRSVVQSQYGHDLPKNVVGPADKFMHAQTSYVGVVTSQICCAICCGIIVAIMWQSKNMSNLFIETFGPEPGFAQLNSETAWILASKYGWATNLITGCVWFCISAVIIAVARKCVTDGNTGGLCGCAVFEGICGCCHCLECLSQVWYLVLIIGLVTAYSTIPGREAACTYGLNWELVHNFNATTGLPISNTGVKLATTTISPTNPKYASCIEFMAGARSIFILFAVQVAFTMCCQMSAVSACFSGMAFAKQTKDALEDSDDFGALNNDFY